MSSRRHHLFLRVEPPGRAATAIPAERLSCRLRGRRGSRNHYDGTAGFSLVARPAGCALITSCALIAGCTLRAGVSLIARIALAAGITARSRWAGRAGDRGTNNYGLRRRTITGAQAESHNQDCEWN